MPTIPSIPLQTGSSGGFNPTRVVPQGDASSEQRQRLGAALTQAGAAVASVATGLQDQLNDAKVKEAYTTLGEFTLQQLEDPSTGYLNQVGKDAIGDSRKKAIDAIATRREELAKGFDNDVQRGMFRTATDRYMVGVTSRVYGHEAEQMRGYSLGQAKAMAAQSVREAVSARMTQAPAGQEQAATELAAGAQLRAQAEMTQQQPKGSVGSRGTGALTIPADLFSAHTWNDELAGNVVSPHSMPVGTEGQNPPQGQEPQPAPAKRANDFELHKNTAIAEANRVANLSGYPADDPRRAELVLEQTTAIHIGVVDSLVKADRTSEALDYVKHLDRNEMTPEAYAHVDALTRQASAEDDGVRLARELTQKPPDDPFDPKKEEPEDYFIRQEREQQERVHDALAEVDRRFDAEKIDAKRRAIARAEIQSSERERLEERARSGDLVLTEARTWLSQHPLMTPDQMPKDLQITARVLGKEPELIAFARHHAIVTDQKAMFEIDALRDSGKLADMSAVQLRFLFRGRLDDQDWSWAEAQHARAQLRETKEQTQILSVDEVIKEAGRSFGILPRVVVGGQTGTPIPTESYEWFNFQKNVQKLVEIYERTKLAGKRKASPDEVQKLIDDALLDKVYVPHWPFDQQKSVIALHKDNPMTAEVEDDEENSAYVMALDKQGKPQKVFLHAIGAGSENKEGVRQEIERTYLNSELHRMPTAQELATEWLQKYKDKEEAKARAKAKAMAQAEAEAAAKAQMGSGNK